MRAFVTATYSQYGFQVGILFLILHVLSKTFQISKWNNTLNNTHFVSVILLISVILTTLVLLFVFGRVFQRNRPIDAANDPVASNDEILKTLVEGSNLEVKEAFADPRIKVSVIQLHHLGYNLYNLSTR